MKKGREDFYKWAGTSLHTNDSEILILMGSSYHIVLVQRKIWVAENEQENVLYERILYTTEY